MPNASSAQAGFLGGELSEFAQNRFDKPDYNVSLRVCFNAFPVEAGAWVRRPGFMYAGHSRSGAPGRVVKFDFSQAAAVTMEFTDGYLRFRNGTALITTNDPQRVVAIANGNPAWVQVAGTYGWPTGSTVIFDSPGPAPLLENRQFVITIVDAQRFSIADALTGAGIDGSTLGTITAGTMVRRVHEVATSYVAQAWQSVRSVQAEKTSILLNAAITPQALTVATTPSTGVNAQFALNAIIFNDGPYLDPFTNGVQAAPSGTSGVINLTMSFAPYDSTKVYTNGAFVTSSGVNYVSIIDQNLNNNPGSSSFAWRPTSAGAAINNGQGFLGSDVGRLVRLFSEPGIWSPAVTYSTGQIAAYNPSGVPGASTYWQSLTNGNVNHPPGSDLTNWQNIPQGAAIWTWGKIVSLLNVIDPQLAGSVNIGNLTQNGGLSAAFDGIFTKGLGNCARLQASGAGTFNAGATFLLDTFVGKNYTSSGPQKISSATVYPTVDEGFGKAIYTTNLPLGGGTTAPQNMNFNFTITLRANQNPPTGPSDGTILGFVGPINTPNAISIPSNDTSTAWNFVWIELLLTASVPTGVTANAYILDCDIAQVSFYAASGTGTTSGVKVEILGQSLLYTNPILTWQLGLYSGTTGFPTCGVYHEGRLWLAGAIENRFDACVSGGISGTVINFAPTNAYGQVADSNAISYKLDTDSVNPIFDMHPELQGIVMRTEAAEFLVQAPTNGPITPNNIAARRVTKIGSSNIEARRTEHTTIFVHRYQRKLMEYFGDVYSGKFSAPNLADKAQHVTRAGVAEIAYQQATTPIIWGRDAAGALFSVTYKRDTLATSAGPTFVAWARHGLGSGRIAESLCVGPSVGGTLDSLTIVSSMAGSGVRHVEVLTDTLDELSALTDARYLDDAVAPSSYTVSTASVGPSGPYGGVTFNGLWHLNGSTVQVWAGGLDCGDRGAQTGIIDFTVSNGSVFVPFGDGVSAGCGQGLFTNDFVTSFAGSMPVLVGFTYTSKGQTLRTVSPQESGARNGPALGKITRNHRYAMHVSGTRSVSVGGTFDVMKPVPFTLADGITPIDITTVYTGLVRDTLDDDYSLDGFLSWQVTRPYPANIVSVEIFTATQDQ